MDEQGGNVIPYDPFPYTSITPPTAWFSAFTVTSGALTPSGSRTITVADTVLENLDITGYVTVQANNVTIRNCRINGEVTRSYSVKIVSGTGTLIEDCEMFNFLSAAVLGSGFTARRCYVHDSNSDGFKPTNNALIEYCYAHHLGKGVGAHADAVQHRGGTGLTVRYNYFDLKRADALLGYKSNACLMLQADVSPISNVLLDNNWLEGGGYTTYALANVAYAPLVNVAYTNNRFGRDFSTGLFTGRANEITWSGNRYWDTNTTVDVYGVEGGAADPPDEGGDPPVVPPASTLAGDAAVSALLRRAASSLAPGYALRLHRVGSSVRLRKVAI
jgi:hypothetical protein